MGQLYDKEPTAPTFLVEDICRHAAREGPGDAYLPGYAVPASLWELPSGRVLSWNSGIKVLIAHGPSEKAQNVLERPKTLSIFRNSLGRYFIEGPHASMKGMPVFRFTTSLSVIQEIRLLHSAHICTLYRSQQLCSRMQLLRYPPERPSLRIRIDKVKAS